MFRASLVGLGLLIASLAFALPLPAGASGAESTAHPVLMGAIRLYEDLEFTAANRQLDQAERVVTSSAEVHLLWVYRGLIHAQEGRESAASDCFRRALRVDRTAPLPKGVAPKVVALWERARVEVEREFEAVAGPAPQGSTKPGAVGGLVASQEPTPEGGWRPRARLGLLIGGGAAVVTAGVLLVAASVAGAEARDARFQSDASAALDRAQTRQALGLAMGITGAMALGGAGLLMLFDGAPAPAQPPSPSAR